MSQILNQYFGECTTHGLSYITKPQVSFLERCFWMFVVIVSFTIVVFLCLAQWHRFELNPIVYTAERNYQNWEVETIGATFCTNLMSAEKYEAVVKSKWTVQGNASRFNYYLEFLKTLSNLTYKTITELRPYFDDTSLHNISLLETLRDMHSDLHTVNSTYVTVITEAGVCVSLSKINGYQNLLGKQNHKELPAPSNCSSIGKCISSINIPPFPYESKLKAFLHPYWDLMEGDGTIQKYLFSPDEVALVYLDVEIFTSSSEIQNLRISQRQCIYYNEKVLSYFNVYTPNLCRIECRIREALKYCGCKPFFYVVGPKRVCNIKEMACLSKVNWYNSACTCLKLCNYTRYIETFGGSMDKRQMDRNILVQINFPGTRIKSKVIFSIDNLITSFGGTASLFIGCNFLNIIEFFYFLIQYFTVIIRNFSK